MQGSFSVIYGSPSLEGKVGIERAKLFKIL